MKLAKYFLKKVKNAIESILNVPALITNGVKNRQAANYFLQKEKRQKAIEDIRKTISTGMDLCQLQILHEYVITHKPRVIFEFGGGVSTAILAQALDEVATTSGVTGHVYSFEDIPKYQEHAKTLVADNYKKYCSFVLRDKKESTVNWGPHQIWGFHYESLVPERPDFVIVDGPFEARAENAPRGVCLDTVIMLSQKDFTKLDICIEGKIKTVESLKKLIRKKPKNYFATGMHLFSSVTPQDLSL